MTIEGALTSMSDRNLTTAATLLFLPYSERYVPASMPDGMPITAARPVMRIVPTIALATAPATPGGDGSSVKEGPSERWQAEEKHILQYPEQEEYAEGGERRAAPSAVAL